MSLKLGKHGTTIDTITRSSSPGSSSGRFYRPVDVDLDMGEGTIQLTLQMEDEPMLKLWPDEAKRLGLALLEAAAAEKWMS